MVNALSSFYRPVPISSFKFSSFCFLLLFFSFPISLDLFLLPWLMECLSLHSLRDSIFAFFLWVPRRGTTFKVPPLFQVKIFMSVVLFCREALTLTLALPRTYERKTPVLWQLAGIIWGWSNRWEGKHYLKSHKGEEKPSIDDNHRIVIKH